MCLFLSVDHLCGLIKNKIDNLLCISSHKENNVQLSYVNKCPTPFELALKYNILFGACYYDRYLYLNSGLHVAFLLQIYLFEQAFLS